ncbi:MAG TPA: hypothetical protein VLZ83_06770 [Edaphocola sp.]|nr:hypothetical protein [Edaphocola sp.]
MDKLLDKLEREYIGKYDCQLRHILQEYSISEIANHIIQWLSIEWKESDNWNYAEITTIARDFYIGSNLTEQEKDAYYRELKQQGFFNVLSTNLYSEDFAKCSWTIYTFGKFSNSENARYLETAYEEIYAENNPILSQRCLNELNCLGSKKVDEYLSQLNNKNDIISKLTLLMYWEGHGESKATDRLLSDKKLIKFISPHNEKVSKNEVLFDRLNNFENHIFKLHIEYPKIKMTKSYFTEIAKNYFESFEVEKDSNTENAHREILKSLSK